MLEKTPSNWDHLLSQRAHFLLVHSLIAPKFPNFLLKSEGIWKRWCWIYFDSHNQLWFGILARQCWSTGWQEYQIFYEDLHLQHSLTHHWTFYNLSDSETGILHHFKFFSNVKTLLIDAFLIDCQKISAVYTDNLTSCQNVNGPFRWRASKKKSDFIVNRLIDAFFRCDTLFWQKKAIFE